MASDLLTLRSGLQFLSCEVQNICRLCLKYLSSSDSNVKLHQHLKLMNRDYYNEPITLADVFSDLGISLDEMLPQLLCETCTVTVVNGFLLPKLLAHSERTWLTVIEHFEQNLDRGSHIEDMTNSLYFPSSDQRTQFLFFNGIGEDKGKAAALSIVNGLKLTKQKRKEKILTNYSNKSCNQKQIKNVIKKRKLMKNMKIENVEESKSLLGQCKICLKNLKSKRSLKEHFERSHNLFPCPKCSELQPSKEELNKHKLIHKSANLISIICPKCNKTYANKIFKLHEKICGEEKLTNFICDYCNQGYIRKNSLRTHIKITHGFGKLHTCLWCKKKFDAISKLNEHTIKHTQIKKFTCEFCGAKCGTAASLACHVRLHTGERPFPCNLCDQKFLSASRRMEHIRRKHVGPQIECHVCSAKYCSTALLKKHLERHSNPNSKMFLLTNRNVNKQLIQYDDSSNNQMNQVFDGTGKDGTNFYVYMVPAKSFSDESELKGS